MINENEIKQDIAEALYDKGIIDGDLFEKCGKPKYIQSLPGDLRTSNIEVLENRLDEIDRRMKMSERKREELLRDIEYSKRDLNRIENELDEDLNSFENQVYEVADGLWGDEIDIGKQNEIVDLWRDSNSTYVNGENTGDGLKVYNELSGVLNPLFKDYQQIINNKSDFITNPSSDINFDSFNDKLNNFLKLCDNYKSKYDTYGLISERLMRPAEGLKAIIKDINKGKENYNNIYAKQVKRAEDVLDLIKRWDDYDEEVMNTRRRINKIEGEEVYSVRGTPRYDYSVDEILNGALAVTLPVYDEE